MAKIEFIRGNTKPLCVKVTHKDGNPVSKNEIDTIISTCRKLPRESSPIIFEKTKDRGEIKIDDAGKVSVTLEPKDTEDLEYGVYWIDIQVTLTNGVRKTAVAQIELTEKTTFNENEVE